MDLEFEDITYRVNRSRWSDKGGRTLLHGISGCFRSGELSVILGPSGAGKSTLLDILSGYRSRDTGIKGSIRVNGKALDRRLFRVASRYLAQEDVLAPMLTAGEATSFAANLKLSHISAEERVKQENRVLGMLGLLECRNTRTEALSGGEKKRLSLALELIDDPLALFLDEPTSGLDNVSTRQCLQILSSLAKQGRTIVCTLHQPSASLFELFDRIYVLGKGRCVYQGAVTQLVPFLSSAGYHCPTYHNPTDFVVELIDSSEYNISVLSKAIDNGKLVYSASNTIMENIGKPSDSSEKIIRVEEETEKMRRRRIGSALQFLIIIGRMYKQIRRNRTALLIAFFHHLVCGLLVGWVFFKTARNGDQMFNNLKFCVGYVLFYTYTYVMLPVLTYPTEVKLLKREHFNRWYRLNPYFAALVLFKIPMQLIFGLMFSTIVYFMSGLPVQFFRYFYFALIGFGVTLVSDGLGMSIGAVFSVTNGSALGPAIIAPILGLAVYGFDFASKISTAMHILMKTSFIRSAVIATAITLFGYDREMLDCHEMYCHFKNPRMVLRFLDVENASLWDEILLMALLLILFRTLNYLALRYRLMVK